MERYSTKVAYYNASSRVLIWPELVNAATGRTLQLNPGEEVEEVLRWVRPTEPGQHATLAPLPADFVSEHLKPVIARKGAKGAVAQSVVTTNPVDPVGPELTKE